MKKLIILFFAIVTVPTVGQSCKVLLKAISEKYEGTCKKGKAHGKGKAWGKEDSYEGEFKKGKPHGKGTYKWANGNVYQGAFKKGIINGKGSLYIKKTDKTQKGYFKKGKYVGVNKYPYKIISQSGVRRVTFLKKSTSNNEIAITVFANGNRIYPEILINDLNNSTKENRNGLVLTNVYFPLKRVELSFVVNGFAYKTTFAIYKKSDWEVRISL